MNAVEARWHEGIPQYRVRYGPVPDGYDGAWYWYINQDQASFSAHVHEFSDQGFVLLDPNSYLRPDDTRRYQGVWHKLFKKKRGRAFRGNNEHSDIGAALERFRVGWMHQRSQASRRLAGILAGG